MSGNLKYIHNNYQAQQQQLLQTPTQPASLQQQQQQHNNSEASISATTSIMMNGTAEPRIDDLFLHPTLSDYYNRKFAYVFLYSN